VKITGKNLRELALTFQKFTIDWVKELQPGRFVAAANGEGVHIASIAVTKFKRNNDRVYPYDRRRKFVIFGL